MFVSYLILINTCIYISYKFSWLLHQKIWLAILPLWGFFRAYYFSNPTFFSIILRLEILPGLLDLPSSSIKSNGPYAL